MFEDWAVLFVLPAMGLGFATTYLWYALSPSFADEELNTVIGPWREVAQQLGGRLEISNFGPSPMRPPRLVADVYGVKVTIEARAWREWTFCNNAVEYTRQYQTSLAATADCPRELHLSFSLLERERRQGSTDFNERFELLGENLCLARIWMSEEFKKLALATKGFSFILERGTVTALTDDLAVDPAQLDLAVRAVAALCHRSSRIYSRWEQAAALIGGEVASRGPRWSPDGRTKIKATLRGCSLEIDVIRTSLSDDLPIKLRTRVRARVTDRQFFRFALHGFTVPRFALYFPRVEECDLQLGWRYILRSSPPELGPRRLRPELCQQILALNPIEVSRDARWVTVVLQGLVESPTQLEEAASVAVDLASPAKRSPYR